MTAGRVLFISHDASRTGAPIILLRMLRWFRENTDLEFDVLLRHGGELRDEFRAVASVVDFRGRWQYTLPARALRRLGWSRRARPMAPARLADELRRRRIGLIYSNTITNGEVLGALSGYPCPIICHVHELGHYVRYVLPRGDVESTLRCAGHYIAVSGAVRDMLVSDLGVAPERIDLIHGFIPVDELARRDPAEARAELARRHGVPAEAFWVGGCGTNDWRKATDLFIQIALQLTRRAGGLPVHFLWLGGHPLNIDFARAQHDIERAGLAGRVRLLGAAKDPSWFFAAIDVFALTSREDPFPLVMLEAAAAGKPIVCFDCSGGAPELVGKDCGRVVPYLDTTAFADALVELYRHSELCRRLGRSASQKVRCRHDLDHGARRVLEVIRRFLGGGVAESPARAAAREHDAGESPSRAAPSPSDASPPPRGAAPIAPCHFGPTTTPHQEVSAERCRSICRD